MSAQALVADKIRVLVFTSLYPNSVQPRHGIFVEQRLRALVATGQVDVRVVAPVPWFFSTQPRFGRYADFAAVPEYENRHGLDVLHPRYPVIPKVGMTLTPASMAFAVVPTITRLRANGFDFDIIDAHYFYPDGVSAARLARRFERPLVITARGTDINLIADLARPRRQIKAAATQADALVTVSQALRDKLLDLGIADNKITTLRNGVDLRRFTPVDARVAREQLGLSADAAVWLSVGNLVAGKGVHITIEALARLPDVTLLIVGSGPEEQALRALALRLNVSRRVLFAGTVAHERLYAYYSAADALVFPTRAEGMPNVVLEALACGTAIIASAVGGIPEIITGLPAGVLLRKRSAAAICEAWNMIHGRADKQGDRESRRNLARKMSWAETARGQLDIFTRLLGTENRIAASGFDG